MQHFLVNDYLGFGTLNLLNQALSKLIELLSLASPSGLETQLRTLVQYLPTPQFSPR